MQIYLPIAEISVDVLLILAMGGAVGFLSGMFGVGGGFLMTPFLMFTGIPPAVAVATGSSHVLASSVSGVMTQLRRSAVDLRMAGVMVIGGFAGSGVGVVIFRILKDYGQIDLVVSLSYVVLLGSIGGLMLSESVRTLARQRRGLAPRSRARSHHSWLHGLPLKMRFYVSKLYISALPPVALGFFTGILAAVMGVGGGFIMVPAMIYLLRMPAGVVTGTSHAQILFTVALTTFLHAVNNQTVDLLLAALLMTSGAIGVQFGSQMGARLRNEELRLLLALLVVGVAIRLAIDLFVPPDDPFSLIVGEPQ